MVVGASTAWIDAVIIVSTFVPIAGLIVFSIWFLRQKGD
jgi:hypothetical protein